MRTLALSLAALFLGSADIVFAQVDGGYGLSPYIQNRVLGVESDFERMARTKATKFRLMRDVVDFAPIKGSTIDVPIKISEHDLRQTNRPNSPQIIATLHDRRTGEPLANCQAPCTLKSPVVPPGMLTLYRYGSMPIHRGAEAYAFFDNAKDITTGFNEVDHQLERKRCAIEFKVIRATEKTRDAEPCVRVAPTMPSEARQSGYCKVIFNIAETGDPIDARVKECTEQVFCEPSLHAVQRWIYYPKLKFGMTEVRYDVKSKLSFQLTNRRGAVLPTPDGEMQPCVGSV